jgi:SpoVK/Ycf46/Vps4 family AAA+-type ATPase
MARAHRAVEKGVRRILPGAGWDAIDLPGRELKRLRSIAAGARISPAPVLFIGPRGTGKTLAAEVVAGALGTGLLQVDLAATVSKYIGETEKNLERVFKEAESSGAVLLLDEADALFGKRGGVKDSHDRFANIEIGFLLQRMEEYRGLAILAVGRRDNLDPAFLRRFRFVVRFPLSAGSSV